MFPISRDPPEGGTASMRCITTFPTMTFPISRDPPEGGTLSDRSLFDSYCFVVFPISRDPPEGGTSEALGLPRIVSLVSNF